MSNEIPRRCDILQLTPAEQKIREAMIAVEAIGAHPLLTQAVILLDRAKSLVADYVDYQNED